MPFDDFFSSKTKNPYYETENRKGYRRALAIRQQFLMHTAKLPKKQRETAIRNLTKNQQTEAVNASRLKTRQAPHYACISLSSQQHKALNGFLPPRQQWVSIDEHRLTKKLKGKNERN